MPHLARAVAVVGLVALAAACGERREAPREAEPRGAAGAGTPVAPQTPATDRPSVAPPGPTGTIRGTVTLTGTPPEMPQLQRGGDPFCGATPMKAETVLVGAGGGLANAVVRIAPGSVPAWTPATAVAVDQENCMYRPRVQPGVVGQDLVVKNGDPTAHNVNARRLEWGKRVDLETIFNRGQPSGSGPVRTTLEAGVAVVKLKCDMHGWMQGFVVVSDNPYAAVSAADGAFVIAGVPAGPRTLEVWHELYGAMQVAVTVEPGAEATVALVFDAVADRPASMGGGAATAPAAPASNPSTPEAR